MVCESHEMRFLFDEIEPPIRRRAGVGEGEAIE
jgi:hypothetical protein